MTRFFLSIFPALFRLGDLSKAISQWISKAEQAKGAAANDPPEQTAPLLRCAFSDSICLCASFRVDCALRSAASCWCSWEVHCWSFRAVP